MTDDRSIERAARSWLEEGPTRAPEHAVSAALVRIEATPQERKWPLPIGDLRIGRAHLIGRAMTGIAVLAAVLAGGVLLAVRGPGPGPAVSPSPSPSASATPVLSPSPSAFEGAALLTSTFTSLRNGYSVQFPADWTATPATANWEAGAVNQWGSAALDELRGSAARFVGTSQPLAAGETADEWLAAYGAGSCMGPPANWLGVPIGPAKGLIDADGSLAPGPPFGKGGRLFDAVVIVGGRAYNFTMDGELTHSDFQALLATVTFDPAAAVDSSPAP